MYFTTLDFFPTRVYESAQAFNNLGRIQSLDVGGLKQFSAIEKEKE